MTAILSPSRFDDDFHVPEAEDMGSINHSYLQSKIGALFHNMHDYVPLTELTVDSSSIKGEFAVGDGIIPDIAVYRRDEFGAINWHKDSIKAANIPSLVIEILSPMQAVQQLIDKLAIYFRLGVSSCWLVYPSSKTVAVYSEPYEARSFTSGEIIDENLQLRLSVDQIFD